MIDSVVGQLGAGILACCRWHKMQAGRFRCPKQAYCGKCAIQRLAVRTVLHCCSRHPKDASTLLIQGEGENKLEHS